MKRTILLTLGLSAALLHAQVPGLISYQGRVVDTAGAGLGTGTPVNRKMIFRIFDAATGGNRLWSEEQTVTLANGEFSVLLGQGVAASSNGSPETPKPSLLTVFGGTERYLEIVVDGGDNTFNNSDTPITPRQRLTPNAYAIRAAVADGVAAGSDLSLSDANNGLGWYGTGRVFNGTAIDGPVLYGNSGGALGSNTSGTLNTALRWDNAGRVAIGGSAPNSAYAFDVSGIARIYNGLTGAPQNSENGGSGMKLVLWPGAAGTATPFGFGIDTSTLYSVVPSTALHRWYGGTTERMSLNGSTGQLNVSGSITSSTLNLSGNSTAHSQGTWLEWNRNNGGTTYLLNQKGLGTTGGIVLGEVDSGNTVTESISFPSNGGIKFRGSFDVDAAYGGNTGNFISFAQPGYSEDYMGYAGNTFYFRDSPGGGDSAAPNLFVEGHIRAHGSGLVAAPGVEAGGNGMRLTLFPGTAADQPFGFGINTSTLWSVVPASAAHRWYVGGTEVMSLSSTGGSLAVAGKSVPVAEEELRFVRGIVAKTVATNFTADTWYQSPYTSAAPASKKLLRGSGYDFKMISEDTYEIRFDTAFSDLPSVTVTPIFSTDPAGDAYSTNSRVFVKVTVLTENGATIRTNADDSDNGHHCSFSFIATGPR